MGSPRLLVKHVDNLETKNESSCTIGIVILLRFLFFGQSSVTSGALQGPHRRSALAIPDEANGRQGVDNQFWWVELDRNAKLGRSVVVGEAVVIVVPTFAGGKDTDDRVVRRQRGRIVSVSTSEKRGLWEEGWQLTDDRPMNGQQSSQAMSSEPKQASEQHWQQTNPIVRRRTVRASTPWGPRRPRKTAWDR